MSRACLGALAFLLVLACDSSLVTPSSIEVPFYAAPKTCRGDGKNACPPEPGQPKLDSLYVYPHRLKLEAGKSTPVWVLGWYGGKLYACADDGTKPVGRIEVDGPVLVARREVQYGPGEAPPPVALPGREVITDLGLCTATVSVADEGVASWTPRTWLSGVSAWLRGLFA